MAVELSVIARMTETARRKIRRAATEIEVKGDGAHIKLLRFELATREAEPVPTTGPITLAWRSKRSS